MYSEIYLNCYNANRRGCTCDTAVELFRPLVDVLGNCVRLNELGISIPLDEVYRMSPACYLISLVPGVIHNPLPPL